MLVFIDSNQFIPDYWMRNASFFYFLRFLNDEGHTLLLSRLVIEEVENKFLEQTAKAIEDARKVGDRLKTLEIRVPKGLEALAAPALDLEKCVRAEANNVVLVEYKDVPHEEVVRRALSRKKPFDAEGHDGYRDCLLWMSFLRYLAKHGKSDEEVVFISHNPKDFYRPVVQGKQGAASKDERSGPTFHEDLAADLEALKLTITPYDSVAAFVKSKVDRARHAIDRDDKYNLFEEFLTSEGLGVLSRLEQEPGPEILQAVLGPVGDSLTVLDSHASLVEGMEDLDLQSVELQADQVFVSCTYNLRIVSVDVSIPNTEVEEHRAQLAASPNVWEVEESDRVSSMRIGIRAYFDAAFLFDPIREECSRFSLRDVRVK